MKTQKSSDNEDVTPTKKVLKQARLPFMILSDVSPKSVTPQSRKRKLSVPDPEPVTKLSKISKETDLAEELVVISDDDSKEAPQVKKVDKQLNPYVKLVDTAWKKKAQKAKNSKKKKSDPKKSKIVPNGSIENNENACESSENDEKKNEKVEDMEVDESEDIEIVPDEIDKQDLKSENDAEISNSLGEKCEKNNIVTLEDSNCSEDAKKQNGECSSNEKDSPRKEKDSLHITSENEVETTEPEKNITNSNNDNIVTPKRTNNSKSEEKITDCSLISNCDESLSSNPSTPRRSTRQVSLTNSQDVSLTENTKITPKQLQKKIESAKKKEEREKEKTEREKKRQQEKDERARQKQEKEEQRKKEREEKEEAKKKEKEEKEEQRRKEREEKEKQKELEKKMREEKEEQKRKEREEKEEQKKKEKEAKEEEKRKKQEALEQEKIEQEQKKKKAAEVFVSFFVPKQKGEKEQVTLGTVSNNDILSNFTIKSDMRLAPTIRATLDGESRKVLDSALQEQNVPESSLYIKSLKGSHKPLSNGKTWPLSDKDEDDDVMIVEDELPTIDGAGETIACDIVKHEKLRPKMFAFHENRRPPYWGTWRKRSKFINPRRPFKTDEKLVDYEVDSDEEWEEEQEGESIDGSAAGSDDEQDADEYEVDNEVFVPHGYLSDEEATMDEDDVLSLSPETQKARLKHLEDEFEFEMKKPMEKLKPRLYGLLWETADASRPENCAEALWNYFGKLSMIMNDPTPFLQPSNETEDPDKKKVKKKKTTDAEQKSPKNEKKKKSKIDDKEGKKPKVDTKKTGQEVKKNQPGINAFLTKIKT